jgi:hypothetical protein
MARQTPAGDVEDVLLSVVLLHFLLVVASVAIDRVRPPAMAAGALASSAAVIHGE